jgi:hypothetical protein
MFPYPSTRMIILSEYDRGYSNGQRDILETLKREISDRKRNSGGEPNRDLAFDVCLKLIEKYRGM